MCVEGRELRMEGSSQAGPLMKANPAALTAPELLLTLAHCGSSKPPWWSQMNEAEYEFFQRSSSML